MFLKLTDADNIAVYINFDNVIGFARSFTEKMKRTNIILCNDKRSPAVVTETPEEIAKMINVRSIHPI